MSDSNHSADLAEKGVRNAIKIGEELGIRIDELSRMLLIENARLDAGEYGEPVENVVHRAESKILRMTPDET